MQHALLDAAYGSMQYAAGPAKGSQSGKHKSRYSEGDYGAKLMSGGTSRRRGDWSRTRAPRRQGGFDESCARVSELDPHSTSSFRRDFAQGCTIRPLSCFEV